MSEKEKTINWNMELKEFKADMINCLTTKESTYFVSNKKMGRDENDEEYQKI